MRKCTSFLCWYIWQNLSIRPSGPTYVNSRHDWPTKLLRICLQGSLHPWWTTAIHVPNVLIPLHAFTQPCHCLHFIVEQIWVGEAGCSYKEETNDLISASTMPISALSWVYIHTSRWSNWQDTSDHSKLCTRSFTTEAACIIQNLKKSLYKCRKQNGSKSKH